MDWHLFSLLLSCVLMWLGGVWSVILALAICLTLAVKRLMATFKSNLHAMGEWAAERASSFGTGFPEGFSATARRYWTLCLRADAWLMQMAKARAHGFVSILLIVGLVVLVATSSVVIGLGVHREGAVMVSSCGSFAVDAVNKSEALQAYLPSGDTVSTLIESARNSTYTYARQYVNDSGVKYFGPSFNVTVIEEGLVRLWHLNSANGSSFAAVATGGVLTTESHHLYRELPVERVVRQTLAGDFTGAYDSLKESIRLDGDGRDVLAAISHFDFGLVSTYLQRGAQMLTQNVQVRKSGLFLLCAYMYIRKHLLDSKLSTSCKCRCSLDHLRLLQSHDFFEHNPFGWTDSALCSATQSNLTFGHFVFHPQLGISVISSVFKLVISQSVAVGQAAVAVATYLLALFYLLSKPTYTPMDKFRECLPVEMQERAVEEVNYTLTLASIA